MWLARLRPPQKAPRPCLAVRAGPPPPTRCARRLRLSIVPRAQVGRSGAHARPTVLGVELGHCVGKRRVRIDERGGPARVEIRRQQDAPHPQVNPSSLEHWNDDTTTSILYVILYTIGVFNIVS